MEIALTHSSTACVLLEIGSIRILTDPVLDDGSRDYKLGPLAWSTRYKGPSIPKEQLLPIDAVLLSHAHHKDDLDDTGMSIVRRAMRVILGPKGVRTPTADAELLSPWEETTISGKNGERVRVIATPARHGPKWLPGTSRVVGFVLQWDGQEYGALYISGDTVFFRGVQEVAERFRVSTAVLHLGAVHFWPPWPPLIRFTFNGRETARAASLLGARSVIPIHYEQSVWSHFHETVESYRREFEHAGVGPAVKWLEHGKRTLLRV
jgi:L-ascorbate metabolism protein UlaG (beta-lactamase superfamily)